MQDRSGAFCLAKALAFLTILTGALPIAVGPGRAQTAPELVDANAPEVKALAGPWDLVEDVPHQRRCRIQLNGARPDRNGLVVGIQTPCRMSIPELSHARRWGLDRQGHIRLYRDNGREIVAFNSHKQPGGTMRFTANAGESRIALETAGERRDAQKRDLEVAAAVTSASSPSAAVADETLRGLIGRYTLARSVSGPGCSFTLELEAAQLPKARKATLDPACTDTGLKVFDPVGWRLDGERLFLIARKGHAIGFTRTSDGNFVKDPPQGNPLVIVRK